MNRTSLGVIVFALVAASLAASAARATDAAAPLDLGPLRILPGTWHGEGTVSGMPSKIVMSWHLPFEGRFVRVTWSNTMTGPDGRTHRFAGEGTYDPVADSSGVHRGTWFDSQGAIHPLAGRVAGDSLVTEWGPAESPRGRTTYRLVGKDEVRVHDEIRREGGWRTFGRSTFRRSVATTATPGAPARVDRQRTLP